MKINIDENLCIGCGTCQSLCPDCFELRDSLSHVKKVNCQKCDLKEVASSCPVSAIKIEEEKEPEEEKKD